MKNTKNWNKFVIRKDGTNLYCDGNTNVSYITFVPLERARLFTRLNFARAYVTRLKQQHRRLTERMSSFNHFTHTTFVQEPTEPNVKFNLDDCSIIEVVLVPVDEVVHPLSKP